jgi:hypothetical protein
MPREKKSNPLSETTLAAEPKIGFLRTLTMRVSACGGHTPSARPRRRTTSRHVRAMAKVLSSTDSRRYLPRAKLQRGVLEPAS